MAIKSIFLFANLALLLTTSLQADTKKFKISGTILDSSGYSLVLLSKDGSSRVVSLGSSGKFSISGLSKAKLRGATLQLVTPAGRYAGPVILSRKSSKAATTFSGNAIDSNNIIKLGKIEINENFARVKGKLDKTVYGRRNISVDEDGKPLGAGEMGLVSISSSSIRVRADEQVNPGADADLDGIPDPFDADDDGDLVLDASDPDAAGLDVPYTSLIFDFRRTLNAHVRSGLSDSVIDEAISGENVFALTFFFSLPSESSIDGGHVICSDSLVYCRKDTPTAYYGGISESSSDFRDHLWSELLTSEGYPRMENISLSGGFQAIAASIQPRVGRSQFQPGDVYQVVLTSDEETVSTRSLALTPYFVSIPAVKEYNPGSGTVVVDYNSVSADSGSIPGTSSGDPIVLDSSGALTVTFWRPQREALRSDETGYYDWGNLHYGMVIEEAQATCAGYYSGVSSELTVDDSPLGTDDSPLANQGANMYPYTDSQGDRAANSSNTLSFTVNLRDCLARVGRSAGTYRVNVSAVGEELTGGQNAASQSLFVTIP